MTPKKGRELCFCRQTNSSFFFIIIIFLLIFIFLFIYLFILIIFLEPLLMVLMGKKENKAWNYPE